MQYILDQKEYDQLREHKLEHKRISIEHILEHKADHKKLQKLCTEIADKMPIVWGWGNFGDRQDPKPWGCILSQKQEWYCDSCPVSSICPNPNKAWSK